MAKKKPTKPVVEDEDELEEVEDELLEEDDLLSEYPKISETPEKDADSSSSEESDIDSEEEEEPFEIEEEPRYRDFRHLKLDLIKTSGEHDYELSVEGQSHGFCNILVKHLLQNEGVTAAAYKVTGIVPPQIFIRLDDSKTIKIKDILYTAIEALREEVLNDQKLFQKLM
ncbi:MAG: RpoL/Rpb11 RNA polymerase subunit family protein [Promethearchaeota archaeon]|jgi:DNA-directed RNA polymerase subunit L